MKLQLPKFKSYKRKERTFQPFEKLRKKLQNEKVKRAIAFMNKYALLFHIILAAAICFFVEVISRHSAISACSFVFETPWRFLYNVMLVYISLLIAFPFRIRAFIRIVITAFWLILGTINGVILASRVTPFNFTDLKLFNDVLELKNNYFSTSEMVLIIVAIAALAFFLVLFAIKGPKFRGKPHRIASVLLLVACVSCIPTITSAAVNSDILAGYFGNLAQGYKDYGFIYSFSSSVVDRGMVEPANYTEEAIDTIENNITTPATTTTSEDAPNIICVLLESFVDPSEINFLNTSEDPIPNFHALEQNYSTGHLTVPVVGAGTANTEFEILTGMSIEYFGLGEYPYKTVLKNQTCESIANDLGNVGYSSHAVHNNGGNFYGRASIFSQMGFDSFTSKELMNITDYNEIGTWPKDHILVNEVTKCLDSTPDQQDFVYNITVQAHGSYPEEKVFENPTVSVSGAATDAENNEWEYYVNELNQVDTFIGDLINEVSQRDEKTMIVFFGDHLPTMGLTEDDMATGSLYETKYITWNNFGLEKQDEDLTSYQLMAAMTDRVGIHEGTMFRYHQDSTAVASDTYKQNMELLQYDLLYGSRFAYNGEDLYPASTIEMGVEDVTINRVNTNPEDGMVRIYGSNFTPWSRVYVNDSKVTTRYISDHCVQIKMSDISDGDTFVVNQVGSSDTVFRSSNTWTYEAPVVEEPETVTGDESQSFQ